MMSCQRTKAERSAAKDKRQQKAPDKPSTGSKRKTIPKPYKVMYHQIWQNGEHWCCIHRSATVEGANSFIDKWCRMLSVKPDQFMIEECKHFKK